MSSELQTVLSVLLAVMGASVVVAIVGLLLLVRHIRQLHIPRDADFFTTMRMVPLLLVVLLDLLDFGLDIFSAPLIWVALDRMGLPSLRNKAVIEAVIPITGPIPTFTICWIAARVFKLGAPELALMQRFGQRHAITNNRPHPDIIEQDYHR